MNRIIAETISAGKMFVRSRVGLFFTLIFPVLLILVFGAIFSQQGSTAITLRVQNLDDGPFSDSYIEILNMTQIVKAEPIPVSENILDYISDNSLTVALLIPEGFTEEIQQLYINPNSTPSIEVVLYGDPSNQAFLTAQAAVSAAADIMNYNLSGTAPIILVNTTSVSTDELQYIDFFLPGIIGFTIMTTGLFGMTGQCAEYRSRGFFKLLATTTLRKSDWLIANFIIYTGIVLASLFLMTLTGIAAFDLTISLTALVFVFVLVGVLLFTGLGMLIGTVVKDPETGAAISNAIGFPMMFLSGVFFPLEATPIYLQTIASFLPLTYLANGLRDTMIYDNTAGAISDLFLLVVLTVIFVVLASRLMSWKEK